MEDGNFSHVGGVTKWNSQFFIHTWTFLAIIFVASQLFLCLFWINIWLKNKCLQHPCFKNLCKLAQTFKSSDSNAQHFLSDLLTHSRFHSMLFALPSYQFPYIVMNRCLYLNIERQFQNFQQAKTDASPKAMMAVMAPLSVESYKLNQCPMPSLEPWNFEE
jgi:hypothetical protein